MLRIRFEHVVVLLSVVGLVALAGCDKKEKKPDPAPAAAPAPKWKVDAALAGQLRKLSTGCEIDSKRATIRCKDGTNSTLVRELLTDKRSRVESLETFVALLEEEDEKLQIATASVLYECTRSGMGKKVAQGSISKKVAGGLRERMLTLPSGIARQLAPATAHAAALSGDLPALYAAIDGKADLASATYRFIMAYGRLDAFEKVKKLAEDPRSGVRLAALEAPRNMLNWTPKDRAAICPWASGLLTDKRPMVGSRAAALLSRCTGEHVDKLLDRGQEMVDSGEFSRGALPAYRDLCSGMRRRAGGGATKDQCERNQKMLARIVDGKEFDQQTRALALSALAYQWPNEQSLDLARKYAKSDDATQLTQQAKGTVQRLERRLSAQQPAKGPQKPSIPPAKEEATDVGP